MNHTAATATIKASWLSAWQSGPLASLPIRHQNLPFAQPKSGPWGSLSIAKGTTTPKGIGPESGSRTPFVLTLQIFCPEGSGTKLGDQAADAFAPMDKLCTYTAGLTVHYDTTSVTNVGPSDETDHDQINASISGFYDLAPVEIAPEGDS